MANWSLSVSSEIDQHLRAFLGEFPRHKFNPAPSKTSVIITTSSLLFLEEIYPQLP